MLLLTLEASKLWSGGEDAYIYLLSLFVEKEGKMVQRQRCLWRASK